MYAINFSSHNQISEQTRIHLQAICELTQTIGRATRCYQHYDSGKAVHVLNTLKSEIHLNNI
jgi:hypothetical protein